MANKLIKNLPTYIVIGPDGGYGTGRTLDQAWDQYTADTDNYCISDAKFYRAEEIEVESKIVEKVAVKEV